MSEPTPPTPQPRPNRRSALLWLAGGAGAAATAAVGVPLAAYLGGAVGDHPVNWVPVGKVADLPVGETRLHVFTDPVREPWDGACAKAGAYVRYLGPGENGEPRFWVFAMNCTHLGCPVTWFPQSGLFMCPCHGGVYYENGEHASGPPPRGLYHMPWRVVDGVLEVQAPHLPTLQDTLEKPSGLVQLGRSRVDRPTGA